jgi:hypothetical protein
MPIAGCSNMRTFLENKEGEQSYRFMQYTDAVISLLMDIVQAREGFLCMQESFSRKTLE